MTNHIFLVICFFTIVGVKAQHNEESNHYTHIEEVVVSGNTFEQNLKDVPIPIVIIDKKQILRSGSTRLDDILMEQTGISIVHDHGTSLQMQGMSGEYTIILLNGEPMIGRTAGTLDLSSISINNIKRIEITKGPCSALYGSDALAGVVNIVTDESNKDSGSLAFRYGSNTTMYGNGDFNFVRNKIFINISADRYSTKGYNLNTKSIGEYGQTQNPFENYTFSAKVRYKLDDKWKFSIYSRYYDSDSDEKILDSSNKKLDGYQKVKEFNIQPNLSWVYNDKLTFSTRMYISSHKNNSQYKEISTKNIENQIYFKQMYYKIEEFSNIKWDERWKTTIGIGFMHDEMEATRYRDRKTSSQFYGVWQMSYLPFKNWNILAGFRYDDNSIYGYQFNPKFSTEINITTNLSLQASLGRGFKAPEFRHLYLVHNNLLVGYSVYGTQEIYREMSKSQNVGGVIDQLLINPSEIRAGLNPETSWAYNFGVNFKSINDLKFKLNLFRNDIDNMINYITVARKTNGQFIYSYKNLGKIYTQGLEGEMSIKFLRYFTISEGYQYLEAKDKDVIEKINKTNVYGVNNQGKNIKIKLKDYYGLVGRSRHSFNTKLSYESEKGLFFNLRGIYRGKYGFADRDGNGIITTNNDLEFAPGYFLLNASIGKKILNNYDASFGVDNLSNYKNDMTPEFAGRLFWVSLKITY